MRRTALVSAAAAAALVTGGLTAVVAGPAAAAAGCRVDYRISSQWQNGFGAAVSVTNLGDPVTAWSLTFAFGAGQTVTQLWNGTVSQSGSQVTVRNAPYNGSVGTGATVSFGFNGSHTGANPVPTAFALNGTACTGGVTQPPTPTPPATTPPATTPPATTPPPTGGPVRVMALGDSITGSPGCWRALLWQQLQRSGHTDVDFVGTLPPQGCGFAYDGENEGHGGFLATNVADQNQLPAWLSATRPDVVMMHFGTNDVWNNRSPETILAAFGKLVDQMRASKPTMRILVAQIIPMTPSNCAACTQRVVDLNRAVPAWAAAKSTAASPITVVDQFTGFDTAVDTTDGVHPDASGDQKIANRWYPALVSALG
jgi:lysophospholipase L1-like esterase